MVLGLNAVILLFNWGHFRSSVPARLARPPHSAWLEGGPEGEADGGQAGRAKAKYKSS